jgi:hypothetical protein
MSRVFFALLSVLLACGLSVVLAPPALAINCDVATCINICSKDKHGQSLMNCNSWCQITIEERKNKGQCKK